MRPVQGAAIHSSCGERDVTWAIETLRYSMIWISNSFCERPIEAVFSNVYVPCKDHDIRISRGGNKWLKFDVDVAKNVQFHRNNSPDSWSITDSYQV